MAARTGTGWATVPRREATTRLAAVTLATLLGLAVLPAGAASADDPEPRSTERICHGDYVSDFDDIEGSAHEENIRCMADQGLTEGTNASGGESYAPRDGVTRDQMASFIARFLEDYTGEDLEAGDDDRFDDVGGGSEHADNVNKLANIDVVEGTSASGGESYAPRDEVTRDQMAAFIRRAVSWLDDHDARNASVPEASGSSWFDDTDGSVHEPDIDALAEEHVVAGFEDGDYRPRDVVLRDQMASFVMRGYDYALEAELDGPDEDPPPDEPGPEDIAIVDPTSDDPLFPVPPGDDVAIAFDTDRAGDYVLELGDAEEDEWSEFSGGDPSGTVEAGTHEPTVTVPDDEEEGERDLRLTFTYDATTVTVLEESALLVGDGVVQNVTEGTFHFSIQEAVDEADDENQLLAVGEFEETVEIDGRSDLGLGALPGTTLSGSIVASQADGLSLSELTIVEYAAVVDEPVFGGLPGLGDLIDEALLGEHVGLSIGDSADVLLAGLDLQGDGEEDTGIAVDEGLVGTLVDSTIEGNDLGVLVAEGADLEVVDTEVVDNATGLDVRASGIEVADNAFAGNTTGMIAFGGTATVSGNEFDAHGNVAVDLISNSAAVEENTFGAGDAEHVCFEEGEYVVDDLVAANTFDYADDPRTRDEAEDRTCLGPAEEENGEENGDEDTEDATLPLP